MKNILNISLILFNIIIVILILFNIKKNKEYFNNFKKIELFLGEHFQENNISNIKCKKQKDEVIKCNQTNCSIDKLNIANINLDDCLEN
jgi:hypothetical protein|tara:strand:+ start:125 stop:391 length:267 start_codon:yes stop_codon:yes gene_type:complete